MENIQQMLVNITQDGLNDYQIAAAITDDGCKTSQSIINRLRNGVLKRTSYDRGIRILAIHKSPSLRNRIKKQKQKVA